MSKPNVQLFSKILYEELDSWLFIDPDFFQEIAEECPEEIEFTGNVPDDEDSHSLAHILYNVLVKYEKQNVSKPCGSCDDCDDWSC